MVLVTDGWDNASTRYEVDPGRDRALARQGRPPDPDAPRRCQSHAPGHRHRERHGTGQGRRWREHQRAALPAATTSEPARSTRGFHLPGSGHGLATVLPDGERVPGRRLRDEPIHRSAPSRRTGAERGYAAKALKEPSSHPAITGSPTSPRGRPNGIPCTRSPRASRSTSSRRRTGSFPRTSKERYRTISLENCLVGVHVFGREHDDARGETVAQGVHAGAGFAFGEWRRGTFRR